MLGSLREAIALFRLEADRFILARTALAFAILVAVAALSALGPLALKYVVDGFSAGSAVSHSGILLLGLAYAAAQFLGRALAELQALTHGTADQRLQRHLSRRLLSRILWLPLGFHLERRSGAIGTTLNNGLGGYLLVQHSLYSALPVLVELGTLSLVLTHLGRAEYLVILGASGILYLLAFARGAVRTAGPARALSDAEAEAGAMLTDSLLNYETIKLFSAESRVAQRYDQQLALTESQWRHFFRLKAGNGLAVAAIFTSALAASLAFAATEVARGTMTAGDFVLVNAYVAQVVKPLELLGFAARDVSQGLASMQRMLLLLKEQPEPQGGCSMSEPVRGRLEFHDVSFSYRRGRPVLAGVSFSIAPGRQTALVGASGSGKSSIIRLLFRLYEPDGGRILLDGVPSTQWSLAQLRSAIAVVPQDTVLFNDTIGSNIAFGRQGCTREDIENAARVARLHDVIVRMPEGYATRVGERGLKLSGGEKQRVAIARAVIRKPRILVFDEATASLDSRTEAEIVASLAEIARECATLVIAHRLSTVMLADEILVLEGGRVVEQGNHLRLLERKGAYAKLWCAQQRDAESTA